MIAEFARALNNHIVNETKTPSEKVASAYQNWRAAKEERENIDAYTFEQYQTGTELPRAERRRMYDEYCAEKHRLGETWKYAPMDQKIRALKDWISFDLPAELVEKGTEGDRIYTKNVISIM